MKPLLGTRSATLGITFFGISQEVTIVQERLIPSQLMATIVGRKMRISIL